MTLLPSLAFCLCSLAAHADTVFNVSAYTGQTQTLSGTLTLDASSTSFDAATLTYNGLAGSFTFDQFLQQGPLNGQYEVTLTDTAVDAQLYLLVPGASLNGYQGSQICTYIDDVHGTCGFGAGPQRFSGVSAPGHVLYFTAGTVSPPSVTPEPSSFVLLGTGLLGAAGVVRRRAT